jgi:hypothetical protein
MTWRGGVAVLALAALAMALLSWRQGGWQVPDRHDPFAPLSLAETPGWLTRWKLQRLSGSPEQCLVALKQAAWQLEPLPDRQTGAGCGLRNAVRIDRMQLRVGDPFTLSCPAAVSLALWERHVVLPAAQQHFGRAAVRLEHFGSYACRNLYGRPDAARSRHATADALDVSGFVIDGGRRITVARHWSAPGPEAAFLRDVHQGACRWFDAVLGPGYNAAHTDHLHLDRGRFRACR